jgi:hypothetical protein
MGTSWGYNGNIVGCNGTSNEINMNIMNICLGALGKLLAFMGFHGCFFPSTTQDWLNPLGGLSSSDLGPQSSSILTGFSTINHHKQSIDWI